MKIFKILIAKHESFLRRIIIYSEFAPHKWPETATATNLLNNALKQSEEKNSFTNLAANLELTLIE